MEIGMIWDVKNVEIKYLTENILKKLLAAQREWLSYINVMLVGQFGKSNFNKN
jgi:hypothetical protein